MILSFKCRETEKIYNRKISRKFPATIQRTAMRKLWMIDAAIVISDLKIPPSNFLEKLKGKFKQYYSIRVNKQWRICFAWKNGNVYEVQIMDYHK